MTLSDYYPLIIVIGSIIGGIMALSVFYTLWKPVDRRINGDQFALTQGINLKELRDQTVTIRFKSGHLVSDIVLRGYLATGQGVPYQFKALLVAQRPDGRSLYIRVEEIEFVEQQKAVGS